MVGRQLVAAGAGFVQVDEGLAALLGGRASLGLLDPRPASIASPYE